MEKKEFMLMAAPLQGLTETVWRSRHFGMFGQEQGDVEYVTPFIRVEKGAVRTRDMRDFTSELNEGINLTPQIIFRDAEEWKLLVDTLAEAGAKRIDMNMGCPFPPQVHKGRGAGVIQHPEVLEAIADAMRAYAGSIEFSVKMRLGVKEPEEALEIAGILNAMPLRHVAVHPRTASQQYKGELKIDALKRLRSRLRHPVVFNGDISAPDDIRGMEEDYDGVMVGRGLLARPSLFAEYRSGNALPSDECNGLYLELIKRVYLELENRLCGATQLKDKMKPYWEYAPGTLDRKVVKTGKKSGFP